MAAGDRIPVKAKPTVKENLTVETEQPRIAPQKIQVRVMQQSTPEAEHKEYWIERTDGTGQPFAVNARTYNKTFKNNPQFKISQSTDIKKK